VIETFLLLLLASATPAAQSDQAGAERRQRLVMVLPFTGPDDGLAARFTDQVTLKLSRQVRRLKGQTDLKVLSKIEVDEAWGEGVGPKLDTPPPQIAQWLREVAAQVAIWGTFERKGDELIARVKVLDITDDASRLLLDKTYREQGERAHVGVVNPVVEEITGHAVRKPREAGNVPEPKVLGRLLSKNPGFEEGSGETPVGWERMDGLTTFWMNDPTGAGRGKVIKMETRMLQTQADAWWVKWRAGAPASRAPKPIFAPPPAYDSVGGLHGAHYYSDFFEIKPGMRYRVLADFKGKTTDSFFAKVFVKGYGMVPATVREAEPKRREIWRTYLACRNFENQWTHYSETFTIPQRGVRMSNVATVHVKWIRIVPYAYWPPGEFYWDDVKVVEEPATP